MAARKWTEEQRKEQSQKIRQWHPWTKSTGAKTIVGKAISAQNSFKGGKHKEMRNLSRLLKEIKQFLALKG